MISQVTPGIFNCSGLRDESGEISQWAEKLCKKPAILAVRGFPNEHWIKFLCVECAQAFSDNCTGVKE